MEFCQSQSLKPQWLKPYMNSQNRIKTEKYGNKNGKALYKLMNNAVDGKTMENLRKTLV